MEKALVEALNRIDVSLQIIAFILIGIFVVQFFALLFKDNNGGFYLRQINDTLEDMIKKTKK